MKRVLALDIGSVRIGVAVSDPLGMFAQGIAVLEANSRGEDGWLEELDRLVAVYSPGAILLGNPVRTDGRKGPESLRVEAWAERISARYPAISVKLHDERFSTVMAQQALLEADMSRKDRKRNVDRVAAALILQSWLDQFGGELR